MANADTFDGRASAGGREGGVYGEAKAVGQALPRPGRLLARMPMAGTERNRTHTHTYSCVCVCVRA